MSDFSITISRRGNYFDWLLTLGDGTEHKSSRAEPTIIHAADAADIFRRQLALRHFKQQKARRLAENP
jgi:hypothetical protein